MIKLYAWINVEISVVKMLRRGIDLLGAEGCKILNIIYNKERSIGLFLVSFVILDEWSTNQ